MADLSITPANVAPQANATKDRGTAGATITAGQVVAYDPQVGKLKLADSNSEQNSLRRPRGIALHGASDGQPLEYQTGGDLNLGATLVVGTTYLLSETPGGIQPTTDLATGEYVTVLGTAKTAALLQMGLNVTGVAKP